MTPIPTSSEALALPDVSWVVIVVAALIVVVAVASLLRMAIRAVATLILVAVVASAVLVLMVPATGVLDGVSYSEMPPAEEILDAVYLKLRTAVKEMTQ